jgi:hypothetical protein
MMRHIEFLCPECGTLITIRSIDLEASLSCLSCNLIFKLKDHLDSKSRSLLRRMSAEDYLTLGNGLYGIEGAKLMASTEPPSQFDDQMHPRAQGENTEEN